MQDYVPFLMSHYSATRFSGGTQGFEVHWPLVDYFNERAETILILNFILEGQSGPKFSWKSIQICVCFFVILLFMRSYTIPPIAMKHLKEFLS